MKAPITRETWRNRSRAFFASKPRPKFVAWLLTFFALWVFAKSYEFAPIFTIPGEVVALEATLIVLIWTAYHTYQGVLHARMLVDRENVAGIATRTAICTALMAEVSILLDSLPLARHESLTASEVSDLLTRPQLRHALQRSELFTPALASQITAVEGGLSLVEANLRIRERLMKSLGKAILTVRDEQAMSAELQATNERLQDAFARAKNDLNDLDERVLWEINLEEPPGAGVHEIVFHLERHPREIRQPPIV